MLQIQTAPFRASVLRSSFSQVGSSIVCGVAPPLTSSRLAAQSNYLVNLWIADLVSHLFDIVDLNSRSR